MSDKKRILVVEDEQAVSLALTDMLKAEGFEVLSANDGEKGLAIALAEHPDVILTDLKMPGMGGIEMLEKLRKDAWGKDAHAIILSNASDLGSLGSAMEQGAFHYMVKGDTSMADIVAKVRTICDA
ncbi:MAG: response regulator [Minisyncoccia bacterium]